MSSNVLQVPTGQGSQSDVCTTVTVNTDNVIESTELVQVTLTSEDVILCEEDSDLNTFISILDSTSE